LRRLLSWAAMFVPRGMKEEREEIRKALAREGET
jgi:hypothetical protein